MGPQKTPNSQSNTKKKRIKPKIPHFPDFKLYHKTIVIKTQKTDTSANGTEQSPELNPGIYGQIIFNKEAKNTQRENSLFKKQCWENWRNICITKKLDPNHTTLTTNKN